MMLEFTAECNLALRFGASQIPSVRVVASFISVHYTLHALFILLGINHALGVSMAWRVCVACVARARRVRVCVQAFMAFRSLGLFVS